MVKYWRENSVKIVLYLDDGFGMNTDEEQCIKDSNFVRQVSVRCRIFLEL